jgi:hypothetical protein
VGFPQYGFKADLSDDAFLFLELFKPAPGMRNPANGLPSSFVSSKTGTCDSVLCRTGRLFLIPSLGLTALPQRSSLRSGLCCPVHQHLLTSSEPLMNTPRFPGRAGYTKSRCCAGAPRLPTSGSELSPLILVSMLPSSTTENSPVAHTQFLHWRRSLHLHATDSAFSTPPP